METKLFDSIIFGPIKSRRLGVSLGINLLPIDSKLCNFDCIYCECGWTDLKNAPKFQFNDRFEIKKALENKLIELVQQRIILDSITFAGNGEPTLHPEFDLIIDDTIELRNKYFPDALISVLSNSLMLNNNKVVAALKKIDKRILKLDAGTEELFQLIDQPLNKRTLEWVVYHLNQFNG
ncbi:MAG: radical SAM protein, partial [Bacteroidia bacterium]|nr:radical SAM protein [Bacteroidia bacterium]